MRHSGITTLTIASCLLVSACGGSEGGDMAGEPAADTPAAAESASTSELGCFLRGATVDEAMERPSPLGRTEFSYSGGEGLLCYGAPSARGREIMGGLVPFGEPWRIGANEPTTIHLTGATTVGGVALEPGSHSLYAIPTDGEWEFLINTSWERWGIPIDANVRSTEIGSFTVTPESTADMVETLRYDWEPAQSGGALVLEWEDTRLRIPVGQAD